MPADAFKALSDATRRHILQLLARQGDMTAGEIAAHFSISAPSISHHLAILKEAGLVEGRHVRNTVVYSLNTTVFQQALKWFYDILEGSDSREKD